MKNNIFIVGVLGLLLTSCVSQKKYSDLESLQQNTKELLDTKIHSRKDVEDAVQVPILGDIPLGNDDNQLVMELVKRSNLAEAFLLIRTNLDFLYNSISNSIFTLSIFYIIFECLFLNKKAFRYIAYRLFSFKL